MGTKISIDKTKSESEAKKNLKKIEFEKKYDDGEYDKKNFYNCQIIGTFTSKYWINFEYKNFFIAFWAEIWIKKNNAIHDMDWKLKTPKCVA